MPPLTLRVFISSPGDVVQERLLATRVLERLQGQFSRVLALEPVLWEHEPLQATAHFQEQITPPSQTDIVVCILWSRLGTRLPDRFQRADGSTFASGTEWEFEDALNSARERGRPALLVYRKMAEPVLGAADEAVLLDRLQQRKRLDTFFDRWFGNPIETFRAAFHAFHGADEFEERLERHLEQLVRGMLPEHLAADAEGSTPPTWLQGSPYRGLEAFDAEHAPVFFGRTRAITEVKAGLQRQAAAGSAFLILFGASGSGKSSLVRAGIVPTLTAPGVIEGVRLWRSAVFRPSSATSDLLEGLALAFLADAALPELAAAGLSAAELARLWRDHPEEGDDRLAAALDVAAKALQEREGPSRLSEARLLLYIDQMEELFTLERVGPGEREQFVAVLGALARGGSVWVVATMRSDFYPRCAEIPALVALKDGAGQYDLLPPSSAEVAQMIRYPTRAAGLRFEVDPRTGERLDDILLAAAASDAAALPLLEFTLDELYRQRTPDDILTLEAYRHLGGLEGALAQRAEEVYEGLAGSVQAALPSVLRELVTVGRSEEALVTSRRVPLARLNATPDTRTLVEAFIAARLLVTDRADDGEPVVGIAHEALLRHWPRVQRWLEEDRDFLWTRDRVAVSAQNWRDEGRRADFLLPIGKPLAEAEHLLDHRRNDLDAELVEFITASRRAAARVRRRKALGLSVAVTVVTLFALFSFVQWRQVERARSRTVEAVANLTEVNIPEKLRGVDPAASVPILSALYQATLATVRGMPDTLDTRRARAVSLQLLADMQRRQEKPQAALVTCDEALALGEQILKARPSARDYWNLAVYQVTRGQILEDLGRYEDALGAYGKSRVAAEEARRGGRVEAARGVWYGYMLTASLQLRLQQLPEALAACSRALPLAEARARGSRNVRDQVDLAYTYETLSGAAESQGDLSAENGQPAEARRLWTTALENLAKSHALVRSLADRDPPSRQYLPRLTERLNALRRKLDAGADSVLGRQPRADAATVPERLAYRPRSAVAKGRLSASGPRSPPKPLKITA